MGKKKYPVYKDSRIEWIEDLPEHWKLIKLKHISNTEVSNIDKKTNNNELPILLCNYTDVYYNDEITKSINFMPATARLDQINKFSLKKNDVIITKDSESPIDIAIPTWVSEDLDGVVCGYHLAHIKPGNSMNGKYLFYCLKSEKLREQYYSLANGVTRYGLSKGAIINGVIPLPPVEEQVTISTYLNKKTAEVDSLVASKKKLIELLEEKRQAIITETVTKGLNPDVEMKDSGVEWIGKVPEHWNVAKIKRYLKVINGREIEKELEMDDPRAIDVFGSGGVFKKTNQYIFDGESVLFGRKGTIGRVLYVNQPFWTVDTMYWTKFYKESFPKWFYYMLSVFPWSVHATNTALPSIVGTDIENDVWAIPSYNEQKEISNFLDDKVVKINSLKTDIKNQIQKLKEYRQSLIYEAVTGKIDVREYEKSPS